MSFLLLELEFEAYGVFGGGGGVGFEAKRQRTIQVMDIHDIPKPKNAFFAKPKMGSQGRHR